MDRRGVRRYSSAMVTGASSGIGECFARELAARGCDLVLVARRAEPMMLLAKELENRHGIIAEVLPADLVDDAQLAEVAARLADPARPVELLVNNAGAGSLPPRAFHDQPIDREEGKVRLNVLAPLRLTNAVLPGMRERGFGGILTVSSIAAYWPQPHGATYAATKAFLSSFGETLLCENANTGVHVTTLVPGFTRRGDGAKGGPRKFTLPDFAWLNREDVAREGLDAVERGAAVCVPGAAYRIALGLTRVLPRSLVRAAFQKLWGG